MHVWVCVQKNYTEKSFSSVENYNGNVATKYISNNVQNKKINNEVNGTQQVRNVCLGKHVELLLW